MSEADRHDGLLPSALDRLIDPDSKGTPDRPWYGVAELVEAVGRDLGQLLNTHRTDRGLCDELPEARSSMLAYGFPDLGSLEAVTPQQRGEIARTIEAVIARHEPRLRDVRVVLEDPGDGRRRTIRYRVEGRLRVDRAPDVVFETDLELTTGQYSVKAVNP